MCISILTILLYVDLICLFMLKSLQKNITTNRVMGLQNIQISKKLIHTLMYQDLATILMDTLGHILLFLYFPIPDIIFLRTLPI